MSEQVLTDVDFHSLELHPDLLKGLDEAGFKRLTPIQALTLPPTLAGEDIAGQAQTGTGKTAAFLLSLMQRLLTKPALAERRPGDPRALILAPTRELAIQIHKDAQLLGSHTELRLGLAYGGIDYEKQRRQFDQGVDILIGTPGRLIDYYKQHVYTLRAAEVVVLDEADRMFDLGFIKDVRYLMRKCAPREQRQGMLFSATLSYRVMELAYEHMNSPRKVEVEAETMTGARVVQTVYFPASEEKLPLLVGLLDQMDAQRSIVFVNTKHAAEQVAGRLNELGLPTVVLSGDVPQNKRQVLLGKFAKGELAILVATDVAARGLHIPEVSHVFNFDLPQDPEDYVHRVGRTARFGASGDAISFACDRYAMSLPDIEAYIGHKIDTASIDAEMIAKTPAFHFSRPPRKPEKRGGRSGGGGRRGGPGGRRGGSGATRGKPSDAESKAPTAAESGDAASAEAKPRRRRRRRGPRSGAAQADTAQTESPATAKEE